MTGREAKDAQLNDFKNIKLLGEGAFAAVYKVIRQADGGTYALKKVKLPSLSDKEKQNAMNEIRLLASVQHENIISYKDAFFDEETRCLCIVTELADRGDLMQDIVKCQKERSHLREGDIFRFLIGLAHALQALHRVNIFHRDMKSANIFLGSNSRGHTIAKLGDFNVSTVAKHGLCMTQTGTPYYASPEIWRDMPYDGKSDLWGLGCVMYEAAALKPPFTAQDMNGLCDKIIRGKYKRVPSGYSDDLSDVLATLLQVNPRNRPAAGELLQTPIVRKRAAELDLDAVGPGAMDLLKTIKLPRKLIDLSAYLPQPQYDLSCLVLEENLEQSKTGDGADRIDQLFGQERRRAPKQQRLPSVDAPCARQAPLLPLPTANGKSQHRGARKAPGSVASSQPPCPQRREAKNNRRRGHQLADQRPSRPSSCGRRGGGGGPSPSSGGGDRVPDYYEAPVKTPQSSEPPRLHLPRIVSSPGLV